MRSIRHLVSMARDGESHRYWYQWAWADITAACLVLDTDPHQFADLLAVTSPRVAVTRNVRFALMLTHQPDYKPHDMTRSVWASYRHWRLTGEIRGPKTAPFALALKQDLTAVPLDVWMARALGVEQKTLATIRVRKPATTRVVQAARQLGWHPAETQAAIWATAVRLAGRTIPQVSVFDNLKLWSIAA